MILPHTNAYTKYIRLASILSDVLAITLLFPLFLLQQGLNCLHFTGYLVFTWSILSYFSGFYEIYPYTPFAKVFFKVLRQGVIFLVAVLAFFLFNKYTNVNAVALLLYFCTAFGLVAASKFLYYSYIKKTVNSAGQLKNAIIIGFTPEARYIKELLHLNKQNGYHFMGFFSDTHTGAEIKGTINSVKSFVSHNMVQELYCSLNELSIPRMKDFIAFASQNSLTIKFIPDTKDIFHKNLRIDDYELFPVLSVRKTILHEPAAQLVKRIFDVCFSLFVIITVLSWLTPLLAFLIKLESKGPIFFKQSRPGVDEKEFFCFKFRSMQINDTSEQSVIKNDPRVTRIGKFIRKTSIDEMPQFINVLRGEMSIVGPRPHLWSQNNLYSKTIEKYMVRLYVRPGITGLAQVRGFRGEISTDIDMINRIKYDVFYIENWSLLLDIKIIVQTVVNIFLGDEKAY
ncbi:exopolysaccharide biosynthesis polyprenyl glycosylphosphotransferase [Flavobacterium rhizosphaerae]|uniref:Exopolysaccharide biosynthesis polyprenyl glycosylphosphotransferase n=1 Tax=Flavobacterium rhizosphaerae TaxID=3163298 RepID=A0ABW8Z1C5_9FLAO